MMLPDGISVMLTLKRASKSRPRGKWSDDDYDVFHGAGCTNVTCRYEKIVNVDAYGAEVKAAVSRPFHLALIHAAIS